MITTIAASPKIELLCDRWVKASWLEFIALADDPSLERARFYYDRHAMRIEMSPVKVRRVNANQILHFI
jgi:hypothetical protein